MNDDVSPFPPSPPWENRPDERPAGPPPAPPSTPSPWPLPAARSPSESAAAGTALAADSRPIEARQTGRWFRRGLAVVVVVAVSLTAGLAGGRLAERNDPTTTSAVTANPASLRLTGDALNVAGVLAATQSSVVSIETTVTGDGPWATQGRGAGTGIVLDTAGHILTNAHVIAGATSVRVTLAGDKSSRPATILNADTTADVAVLKVSDTSGLVAAKFGRSQPSVVGDDVVAIGNALALQGGLTVTQGIVSAVNRSITTENGTLTGLIQTDAAISSGNSGGALVNAKGQVIGMNTAVAMSSGSVSASNIGFAISTDTALRVAARLLASS